MVNQVIPFLDPIDVDIPLVTSMKSKSGLDAIFPDRSVLLPPSHVTTYEAYRNWIIIAGGDPSANKKRHTAKREEGHIPRPPNSFMLFRSWATIVSKTRIYDQSGFSKDAGSWWSELTDSERMEWQRVADIVKEHHQEIYPGYRYSPNRVKAAAPQQHYIPPIRINTKPPASKSKPASKKKTEGRGRKRSPSTEPESPYESESEIDLPPLSPTFSDASQSTCFSEARSARSSSKVKVEPGIMEILHNGSPRSNWELRRSYEASLKQKESSTHISEWELGYPSSEEDEEQQPSRHFEDNTPTLVPTYTGLTSLEAHLRRVTGLTNAEDSLQSLENGGPTFAGLPFDDSSDVFLSSGMSDNYAPEIDSSLLYTFDDGYLQPGLNEEGDHPNNWAVRGPRHASLAPTSSTDSVSAMEAKLFSEWMHGL